MPLLKNMHEMSPDHVHEEIELQALDFSSYLPEWVATVPRWRDYYLAHDQQPHYDYLKRVLPALQWLRGPDRWYEPQYVIPLRSQMVVVENPLLEKFRAIEHPNLGELQPLVHGRKVAADVRVRRRGRRPRYREGCEFVAVVVLSAREGTSLAQATIPSRSLRPTRREAPRRS